MAVDADRDHVAGRGSGELADRQPDRRPPRLGILLGPTSGGIGVGGVARPGQPEETAVEADQPGLDLGRAEIDRQDRRLATRTAAIRGRAHAGKLESARATTASAVR